MCFSNSIKNSHERERGATLVEFAFFFLLFVVLTVGLMELGRAIWTYTTVAHAARQAARYALIHGNLNPLTADDPSIEDVVRSNAVGLDPAQIAVSTAWIPSNTRGNVVQVEVSYPFRLVTGGLLLSQDTILLGSTSKMVVAN